MTRSTSIAPVSAIKTAYVSALHRVPNVVAQGDQATAAGFFGAFFGEEGVIIDGRPPVFGPPTQISTIVAWRDRIAAKYRAQLSQELYWNETSDFLGAWPVGFDYVLGFVAAALDQHDTTALAAMMKSTPSLKEMRPLLEQARRRGFSGRFPQILFGQKFWLPLRPTLIIEELDWRGQLRRFGSVQGFGQELTDLRETLAFLHAELPGIGGDVANAWHFPAIQQSWIVSGALSDACNTARAQTLPLWVRGL